MHWSVLCEYGNSSKLLYAWHVSLHESGRISLRWLKVKLRDSDGKTNYIMLVQYCTAGLEPYADSATLYM